MDKKIKKINYLILIKIFYTVLIVIMITILFLASSFLYNNVYKTLSQISDLTNLKQEVIEKNLEKEKFYEILENIENKTENKNETTEINNPFAK